MEIFLCTIINSRFRLSLTVSRMASSLLLKSLSSALFLLYALASRLASPRRVSSEDLLWRLPGSQLSMIRSLCTSYTKQTMMDVERTLASAAMSFMQNPKFPRSDDAGCIPSEAVVPSSRAKQHPSLDDFHGQPNIRRSSWPNISFAMSL